MAKFDLTVVLDKKHVRCVYLNNFRIVGSKPYISENLEYKHHEFTIEDLRRAFPELEINEKPKAKTDEKVD